VKINNIFFCNLFQSFFYFLKTFNNINKPIDQQSDCWSTEAFASDSETHSEDGSNMLRLASNYTAAVNDPLGR
jgi:hypothetical protein